MILYIGEALPSRSLDYLHVGTSSGRSGLKPRTIVGHGWEECGSSQVIWSSKSEARSVLN